ncbi:MAG: PA2779 family protein [Pseudomonadales bacterium]|nr:PA2779 family protein [Pseudomonadales bacterium]
MNLTGKLKKVLALLMAFSLLNISGLSVITNAHGDAISTSAIQQQLDVEEKRDQLRTLMAREEVRSALLERGVSENQIDMRIDMLSDAEVMQMHDQIDELPAGEGFLGTVIALLVIFMLLDIGGVTDIFPAI